MKTQNSKLKTQNLTKQKLSQKEIDHLTKLANLPLTVEEREKLQNELGEILSYMDRLNEVDAKNIKPTSQVIELSNVMREDKTGPSLSQEAALKNTPSTENGFFKVKAIFEE